MYNHRTMNEFQQCSWCHLETWIVVLPEVPGTLILLKELNGSHGLSLSASPMNVVLNQVSDSWRNKSIIALYCQTSRGHNTLPKWFSKNEHKEEENRLELLQAAVSLLEWRIFSSPVLVLIILCVLLMYTLNHHFKDVSASSIWTLVFGRKTVFV